MSAAALLQTPQKSSLPFDSRSLRPRRTPWAVRPGFPGRPLLLDRVVVMLKSSRPYNLTCRGCAKFYRKLT